MCDWILSDAARVAADVKSAEAKEQVAIQEKQRAGMCLRVRNSSYILTFCRTLFLRHAHSVERVMHSDSFHQKIYIPEIHQSPKSTKSRDSDSPVSHGTNSNWDFGLL